MAPLFNFVSVCIQMHWYQNFCLGIDASSSCQTVIKKGECGRMCYSALEPSRKKAKSVTASIRCADVGSLAATTDEVTIVPKGQAITEEKKIEQMAVICKVIAGPERQASIRDKEHSQTTTVGELTVVPGGQTPVEDFMNSSAAVIDVVVDKTERSTQEHVQEAAIGEVIMDMGLEQASKEEDKFRHVRIAAIEEVQTERQEQVEGKIATTVGDVTAFELDEQAPVVNNMEPKQVQPDVVREVTELESLETLEPGAVQTAVTRVISHKGQGSVRKLEPRLVSTVSVSQVLGQEQEPMLVRDEQFQFSEDQLPLCGKLFNHVHCIFGFY